MRRRYVLAAGLPMGLLGTYLLAWPVPIAPETWEPVPVDLERFGATASLEYAERVEIEDGRGPEDIDLHQGWVTFGLEDGRILRGLESGGRHVELADTGGRPLGLHRDLDGHLLVADAEKGLLRVLDDGSIEVLTTTCGGTPLGFADDLDIDALGRIWFSDATTRDHDWSLDIVENGPHGRLCRYEPQTGYTVEVLDGLHFANGVAIDPQQRFVLVVETARHRVRAVGMHARPGTSRILIEGLPGYPDGISAGSDGIFWLAIVNPRNRFLDNHAGRPWLRRMVARLPQTWRPAPELTARVIGIDGSGAVVHDLVDFNAAAIAMVTSVQEHEGLLYLGSLLDSAYARYAVP